MTMASAPTASTTDGVGSMPSQSQASSSSLPQAVPSSEEMTKTTKTAAAAPGEHTVQGAAAAAAAAAGSKRPLMTTTRDGKQLSEKKLRRLEKNRLSARECRRRKREATENLEREINVLEGENLRLRLQLQIGEEAEESVEKEQKKVTESIDELLKSGASEAQIFATIEEFKEKFADYGRDRRSAIEFHLRNVERLLMPTQTTAVAMRVLRGTTTTSDATKPPGESGGDAAAAKLPSNAPSVAAAAAAAAPPPPLPNNVSPTSSASAGSLDTPSSESVVGLGGTTTSSDPSTALEPKAMFQYLVNYLKVTSAQAAALKDSRRVAQELDQSLAKSLGLLDELRSRLVKCGEDLETEFNNVRAILTPTQAAKFLVWVANNSACMHMLNELWNRVNPQQNTNDGGDETPSSTGDNGDVPSSYEEK